MTKMMQMPIRTDDLINHIGSEIMMADSPKRVWATLIEVKASEHQGWDYRIRYADGTEATLQSCFASTTFAIRSDAWAYGCSGEAARWINENVGLD